MCKKKNWYAHLTWIHFCSIKPNVSKFWWKQNKIKTFVIVRYKKSMSVIFDRQRQRNAGIYQELWAAMSQGYHKLWTIFRHKWRAVLRGRKAALLLHRSSNINSGMCFMLCTPELPYLTRGEVHQSCRSTGHPRHRCPPTPLLHRGTERSLWCWPSRPAGESALRLQSGPPGQSPARNTTSYTEPNLQPHPGRCLV